MPFLLRFFDDPGVYDRWGGRPLDAAEISEKYVGRRSPQVECFIVEHDGRDVGLVQYHVADDSGEGGGMDLSLLPDVRGRGVGSAVVHAIVGFVRSELHWQRLTVDPDVSNDRGVDFWKKVGFVSAGVVEYHQGREPYLLLEWPADTQ